MASGLPSLNTNNYTIPKIVNSEKFPKEKRPPHLQDDELINAMDTNVVAQMVMKWDELKLMKEANELKTKKVENKNSMKKNTPIKTVKIEEGEDDSTSIFHKQRFALRPPVVAPRKYWDLYPVAWDEIYYSTHLEHVGLENTIGQKQIALLHDRRNEFKVHHFSQLNANINKDKLATNINFQKDGSAEIKSQDDWASLTTINEVTMALDNLVAAWSCFWPGEQSMVTIRRVITRQKEFSTIQDPKTRKKLLEAFINKMMEINSRRAAQGEVPLTYKEVLEQSKEYQETPTEFVRPDNTNQGRQENPRFNNQRVSYNQRQGNNQGGNQRQGNNQGGGNQRQGPKANDYWESVKKIKLEGKNICVYFNKLEGCKDSSDRCRNIHRCAYMERGETNRVCGGKHSKPNHWDSKNKN